MPVQPVKSPHSLESSRSLPTKQTRSNRVKECVQRARSFLQRCGDRLRTLTRRHLPQVDRHLRTLPPQAVCGQLWRAIGPQQIHFDFSTRLVSIRSESTITIVGSELDPEWGEDVLFNIENCDGEFRLQVPEGFNGMVTVQHRDSVYGVQSGRWAVIAGEDQGYRYKDKFLLQDGDIIRVRHQDQAIELNPFMRGMAVGDLVTVEASLHRIDSFPSEVKVGVSEVQLNANGTTFFEIVGYEKLQPHHPPNQDNPTAAANFLKHSIQSLVEGRKVELFSSTFEDHLHAPYPNSYQAEVQNKNGHYFFKNCSEMPFWIRRGENEIFVESETEIEVLRGDLLVLMDGRVLDFGDAFPLPIVELPSLSQQLEQQKMVLVGIVGDEFKVFASPAEANAATTLWRLDAVSDSSGLKTNFDVYEVNPQNPNERLEFLNTTLTDGAAYFLENESSGKRVLVSVPQRNWTGPARVKRGTSSEPQYVLRVITSDGIETDVDATCSLNHHQYSLNTHNNSVTWILLPDGTRIRGPVFQASPTVLAELATAPRTWPSSLRKRIQEDLLDLKKHQNLLTFTISESRALTTLVGSRDVSFGLSFDNSEFPPSFSITARDGQAFQYRTSGADRWQTVTQVYRLNPGDEIRIREDAPIFRFEYPWHNLSQMNRQTTPVVVRTVTDLNGFWDQARTANAGFTDRKILLDLGIPINVAPEVDNEIRCHAAVLMRSNPKIILGLQFHTLDDAGQVMAQEEIVFSETKERAAITRSPVFSARTGASFLARPTRVLVDEDDFPIASAVLDRGTMFAFSDDFAGLGEHERLQKNEPVLVVREKRVECNRRERFADSGWIFLGMDAEGLAVVEQVSRYAEALAPGDWARDLAEERVIKHIALCDIYSPRLAETGDRTQNNAFDFVALRRARLAAPGVWPQDRYNTFFKFASFHQNNTGNCFFVGMVRAVMDDAENFEAAIRNSFREIDADTWDVRIPLGSSTGRWIRVTRQDLEPQVNPNRGKPYPWNPEKTDTREFLEPVRGSLGFQILEAAFIRLLMNDREGKRPFDRTLLDRGGYSDEAIRQFLGNAVTTVRQQTTDVENLQWRLEDFVPGKNFAVAGSQLRPAGSRETYFTVTGSDIRFVYQHAYAVVWVNRDLSVPSKPVRTVVVINPWDNNETIRIPYDVFTQVFRYVDFASVDARQFFN